MDLAEVSNQQDPLDRVKQRIENVFGSWTRDTTLQEMRDEFDAMLASDINPDVEHFKIGDIETEMVQWGKFEPDKIVLYFHGGGYQMGSTRSHRELMARLSAAGHRKVLGFNYRLAPESRFPAAVDDALEVYRWLLDTGVNAEKIAFAGDSAGAGLAIATMLNARENRLPMPGCAVLLSPWLDMEATGETYVSRARLDPMTQRDKILMMARAYLGKTGDPRNPLASPIHGDLNGLPPILVHVGDHETVLDDSRNFIVKAKEAGCDVELVVWDRMIHHFQIFYELPEARKSIEQIGDFLRRH